MVFVPKTDWTNSPSTATPITAAELLRLEAGIVEGTQDATETVKGNVELATAAELTTGTDLTRPASAKRIADYVTARLTTIPGVAAATETAAGIVELATASEMTTGTDLTRPASVKRIADYVAAVVAALPSATPATETVAGIVELATAAEMTAGTDLTRPASVKRVADYVTAALASVPGVATATETVSGVAQIADTSEVDTGTNTSTIITPAQMKRKIDAHIATPGHTLYDTAITELQVGISAKANLISGAVPLDELPASDDDTPDTLALRRADGRLAVGMALLDDEAPSLLQARSLYSSVGADVRHKDIGAATLPISINSASVFVELPNIVVTDAASDQEWDCEYEILYRALSTVGIQVRHKTAAAPSVTNKLANPSFETNLNNWTAVTVGTALSRGTAGTPPDGSAYMLMELGTGVPTALQATSEWVPTTPGAVWSAALYGMSTAGTPRVFRADIQWGDAAQLPTTTELDTAPPTATGSYVRTTNEGRIAPAGTAYVRVRAAYNAPAAGSADSVRIDAVQLEPTATVPAYGSTGGSGTAALSIRGSWGPGLITVGATEQDYSRITPIRYSIESNLTGAAGGLGASTTAVFRGSFHVVVGGTGLTDQRIELEAAQRAVDAGNALSIVAARATFARTL